MERLTNLLCELQVEHDGGAPVSEFWKGRFAKERMLFEEAEKQVQEYASVLRAAVRMATDLTRRLADAGAPHPDLPPPPSPQAITSGPSTPIGKRQQTHHPGQSPPSRRTPVRRWGQHLLDQYPSPMRQDSQDF